MKVANWQRNAIVDLREYEQVQQSLVNIPQEIKGLEMAMTALRGINFDKTPVEGGTSSYESRLIDNIDRRERLKINLEIARAKVERIGRGLAALSENEALVLRRFYIRRERDYIDRLCEELGYEQAQIYRIKEAALRKFTLAMFGVIDL